MTTVLINCILLRHSSGFQNFWILHCRTSPQTYRQQQYRDLIVRHMHAPVQWVRSLFGCTHLLRRSVASLDATITLTPAYYAYYQTINTCSVIVIRLSLPSSSQSRSTVAATFRYTLSAQPSCHTNQIQPLSALTRTECGASEQITRESFH